MKSTLLMAVFPLALATTAQAAPDAPPSYPLPQAYSAYSQPDVTQCQSAGPLQRDCTIPAMTAGRYLIVATTDATSTDADATQALTIKVGDSPCAGTRPVPFAGKKGVRLGCLVNLLTDQPIVVSAILATHGATPDADGPKLAFRRLPWSGVVQSTALAISAAPAASAAGSSKK